MTEIDDNQHYCLTMVRDADMARYATLLFAPGPARRALLALYAFNQELAQTRHKVSEAMIGEIRLQWWQEAIEGLAAGQVRDHPVIQELATLSGLSEVTPFLYRLIAARKSDLYQEGPQNFETLAEYADAVGGSLSQAASIVCQQPNLVAARNSGRAWTMLGLLRAALYEESESPNTEHKPQDFLPLYKNMAGFVRENLDGATGVKPHSSVFLLNAVTDLHMALIEKYNYAPKRIKAKDAGNLRLLWTVSKAAITGNY